MATKRELEERLAELENAIKEVKREVAPVGWTAYSRS